MNSKSNYSYRLLATVITAAVCLVLAGCGSGGGDSGSGDSPANAVNIKGITFDPATSSHTNGSLIAIPTASYTTVQHLESTPGAGVDPSAQNYNYTVSSTVATDLLFSATALPCTKLTVVGTASNGSTYTTSHYYAAAVSGDTYLLKKVVTSSTSNTITVFDMTGDTGSLVLAVPKDPVVGSVCFYPFDGDAYSPEDLMTFPSGKCTVAEINVTSPQGVTGCVRLQRNFYFTDVYVKPGVGFVYWITKQSGVTHSQTRPGLVGPG